MTRSFLRFAALLIAALAASSVANAHARLDRASPAVGSTVSTSPGQVKLYFTENIEPKFSGADVRNGAGARVDKGSSASGNSISISVGGLSPGRYTVSWHVLSVDSHKTNGSFTFNVGK